MPNGVGVCIRRGYLLPVGISGMWTSREFYLLVGAFEGNIEPCQERVDICQYQNRQNAEKWYQYQSDKQSFRVAVRLNGAVNVRSSFLAVSRSMCWNAGSSW